MGRGPVLSDEVWARIEPLLPAQYGSGRPFRDHRQVIEGIVFRYRCGIAWRDLPERFGPWQELAVDRLGHGRPRSTPLALRADKA